MTRKKNRYQTKQLTNETIKKPKRKNKVKKRTNLLFSQPRIIINEHRALSHTHTRTRGTSLFPPTTPLARPLAAPPPYILIF